MDTKLFKFDTKIHGEEKTFEFSAPIDSVRNSVITNRFCPDELLTGGVPMAVKAINGESEEEFVNDCNMQADAMSYIEDAESNFDIHVGALMFAVVAHIQKFDRLLFGDLLIYMDCFSYLLFADNFSEDDVKRNYARIAKEIVDHYPQYVKNQINLAPLVETNLYTVLVHSAV